MATRQRRRSSSGTKSAGTRWDFSKEEGGGGKRYREGDYLARCIKAQPGVSEEKKTPYIEFHFKFLDGRYKGQVFTQRLYNSPKALWLTRSLIEAVGEEVPESASDWKAIARLVIKKDVIVTVTDNEHDGRIRSQASDFLDPEEFDDDEDEEDDDDEEDDEEEIEDDDDEEDDEEEIEDDDDDDEEEAEEEPPKRRRRSRSSKAKSSTKRKKADDDDDGLEDIDLDDI